MRFLTPLLKGAARAGAASAPPREGPAGLAERVAVGVADVPARPST